MPSLDRPTSQPPQPNASQKEPKIPLAGGLFCRENLLALAIALLLIAIYIATASDSPLWVYQGF